jgi:hypothetical protein
MCPEKNQWHQFIIPKLKNENLESTIFIGWPLNLSPSIAMVTGKMDNGLFEAAAAQSLQCEKSCLQVLHFVMTVSRKEPMVLTHFSKNKT